MSEKTQAEFNNLMDRISTHLPAEKVEQLKGIFTDAPEAQQFLGQETLARSEASRLVNETLAEKQRIAQEREALTALSTKVSEYDAYLQQNYLPRADYDQVVAERNRLNSQFEQLSQNYPTLVEELGLPTTQQQQQQGEHQMPNQSQGGQAPAPPATVANPIQHVTQLAWNQEKQQLASLALLSPAAQHDLAIRHQQLFGNEKPLSNMTQIVQESASTGKSLEEVWAAHYDVPAQLAKLESDRIETTVQQRVDAELAKRVGTMNVGGVGIPNTGFISPFLQGNRNISPDQLSQPGNGVGGAPDTTRIANQGSGQGTAAQAATAAYLSGKYANDRFDMIKA